MIVASKWLTWVLSLVGGGYCGVVRPGAPSAGGEQSVLWSDSMLSGPFPTCRSLCPRRHGESVGAGLLPILGECGAEETRFVHSLDASLSGTVHPARSHARRAVAPP